MAYFTKKIVILKCVWKKQIWCIVKKRWEINTLEVINDFLNSNVIFRMLYKKMNENWQKGCVNINKKWKNGEFQVDKK